MINRFRDHAANERTYLAWIRTAIAIMAFGFLLEKFDIFVSSLGASAKFRPSASIEFVGLGLMFVAVGMIFGSTVRFFHNKRAIDTEAPILYSAKWPNVFLAILMVVLGSFLLYYMMFQLFRL